MGQLKSRRFDTKERGLAVCRLEAKQAVKAKVSTGMSKKQAIKTLAEEAGIPAKTIENWIYNKQRKRTAGKRKTPVCRKVKADSEINQLKQDIETLKVYIRVLHKGIDHFQGGLNREIRFGRIKGNDLLRNWDEFMLSINKNAASIEAFDID